MDEGRETAWEAGGTRVARGITAGEDGGYQGVTGEAREGLFAARHFVQYEAEAVDIAAGGGCTAR
jgi:hypothetical protein